MADSTQRFRHATPHDIDGIIPLMAAFYSEDEYPFSEPGARTQLSRFLASPELGRLWVADVSGHVVGYLVVSLGFSFEYGGRDACIDELYIAEPFRGIGLGREAMRCAEAYCRAVGVGAMYLEVERHRERAQTVYDRAGFADDGRQLMIKRLAAAPEQPETRPDPLYGVQLAHIHHAHFGDLARAAAAHLVELLGSRGSRAGTIVELACGGGISTGILSEAGYDVLGVDRAESMLELARVHAPGARFQCASLWDCAVPPAIAVTAIGEAFCYHSPGQRPDLVALKERLRAIFATLSSPGVLLFDIAIRGRSGATGHRRASWQHERTFVYLDEQEDPEAGQLTRCIDSFRPIAELHRHDRERHTLTLFDPDAVDAALREIGFHCSRATRLGSFELSPGWVAFVAVKP
ncbi:MAG: bifunctional GNAT family N-acetyltransferase/class I SAM-dependent methyltransferase [Myxococcota bacterium]